MLKDKVTAVLAGTSQALTIKPNTPLSYCAYDIATGANTKMVEVSDKISNILTKEIIIFKDNVVPELATFIRTVENEAAERAAKEEGKKPSMVFFEVPEYVLEIAETYKRINRETIYDSALILPQFKESFLDTYFISPRDTVKRYREDFMSKVTGADIERIWNTYLTFIGAGNKSIYELANRDSWTEENINDVYVLEILLKNLEKTIPDDVRSSLYDYNMRIEGMLSYIQNEIERRLKINERMAVSKIVIINTKAGETSSDIVILVHKDNLQAYLTNDGNINAILGAGVSGENLVNVETLINNKDNFIKKWETVHFHLVVSVRTKMLPIYRAVYINAIRKFINKDKIFLKSKLDDKDIIPTAIKIIEDAKGSELYDCKAVSRKLFSEVFYSDTNIGYFLERTTDYGKNGIEVDRAITYTIIDILVEYVGNMIEVE